MKHWCPAFVLMVIIFIASSIPGSELPFLGAWDLLAKKAAHILGYALLAAAFLHALSRGRNIDPLRLGASFCLALLYAASDEWHQSFVSGRTASFWDVAVDAAAIFIGLAAWPKIRRRLL